MKKLIIKPYLFFFLLTIIMIILGFIYNNDSFDINIYDVYFVFEYKPTYFLFAIFLGLIGLNYFSLYWANKSIKKGLIITHIILQLVSLVLFFSHSLWVFNEEGPLKNGQMISIDYAIFILIISFFIFLIATIIHIISFFNALISKSK